MCRAYVCVCGHVFVHSSHYFLVYKKDQPSQEMATFPSFPSLRLLLTFASLFILFFPLDTLARCCFLSKPFTPTFAPFSLSMLFTRQLTSLSLCSAPSRALRSGLPVWTGRFLSTDSNLKALDVSSFFLGASRADRMPSSPSPLLSFLVTH